MCALIYISINGNEFLYARSNYARTKYARTGEWKSGLKGVNDIKPFLKPSLFERLQAFVRSCTLKCLDLSASHTKCVRSYILCSINGNEF